VRIKGDARLSRDALRSALDVAGIQTGVYYPSLTNDVLAASTPRAHQPPCNNATAACREVLSLPVHHHLLESELSRIVDEVRGLLG